MCFRTGEPYAGARPYPARCPNTNEIAGAGNISVSDFQLFPELEALENVLLPATFTGWRIPEALIRRGRGLIEQMHVCPTRKVRALSRGEKQRVAIARAVLLKPGIILADEPTASLDEANAGQVSLLLSGYARTLGSTLLVVSHDDAVLADMDRVLDLNRGIVREAA